jgi:hypothetical protein
VLFFTHVLFVFQFYYWVVPQLFYKSKTFILNCQMFFKKNMKFVRNNYKYINVEQKFRKFNLFSIILMPNP